VIRRKRNATTLTVAKKKGLAASIVVVELKEDLVAVKIVLFSGIFLIAFLVAKVITLLVTVKKVAIVKFLDQVKIFLSI
jgi:hypothetical protein